MSEQIDKIEETEPIETADPEEAPDAAAEEAADTGDETADTGQEPEKDAEETADSEAEPAAGEGEASGEPEAEAEAEPEAQAEPEAEPEARAEPDAGTEDDALPWEEPQPVHVSRGKKRPRKHKKKHRVLRVLAVLACIAALIAVANLQYFDIRETPVIGNRVVSDEDILKASQIEPGKSIFFLNPWLVKSRIKKNLYIESVNIDRHLPGTVEIIVKEREAVAQFEKWGRNGTVKRYAVTDINGMVIKKYKKKKKVTMIVGVTVTDAAVGSKIKVKESGTYRKSMELIRTMRQGDIYFKKISIKGSMVTAYIYDDLVCKGRYRNLVNSIKSKELQAVVYQLYQDDVSKGTINIGDNNYCSFTP
ncbi:MAG: FtsQ-type POTRA domain-containing protein [Firmicutes bacterium]|nr:FtsQ-type POTRA domain-containing protein [Bacillota bacterium]